jgi:hypothetical protein
MYFSEEIRPGCLQLMTSIPPRENFDFDPIDEVGAERVELHGGQLVAGRLPPAQDAQK